MSANEGRIRTNTSERQFISETTASTKLADEFDVTYYDMPMTDYTHVALGETTMRYSVVLKKTYPADGRAVVTVANLPTADYHPDNRYKFDEKIRQILNPDQGESSEGAVLLETPVADGSE